MEDRSELQLIDCPWVPLKQWFTTNQVADMFEVDKYTIYRWIKQHKLRARKFGKSWRFTREDVCDFANSREVWKDPTL